MCIRSQHKMHQHIQITLLSNQELIWQYELFWDLPRQGYGVQNGIDYIRTGPIKYMIVWQNNLQLWPCCAKSTIAQRLLKEHWWVITLNNCRNMVNIFLPRQ